MTILHESLPGVYPLTKRFRELLGGSGMKKARRRIDVNLKELDRVLDGAREAPLSEADHDKLKEALHALAAMLVRSRKMVWRNLHMYAGRTRTSRAD